MTDDVNELPPRKQDAIHRALLAGLLGSVGARGEGSEYAGIRGKKFHLFPGSALFRQRPAWVMAAEVVETTKVYARTVGPVHPGWVERAAAHMVKRTHFDPHWRPDIGRVLAYEKVTLHGLSIVPRRKVHFGPIDPRASREIFIHHALVLGEYETDAAFLAHNRRLIEQVQTLEAKARRRDILVDHKAQFAFYDARVPQRIYSAREFEKWRRQVEKQNPRLLFMTRRDLMLHPALGVTEELYPDALTVDGATFPLEYRFEPAHRADGVTVTIPLAALNQLRDETFQWLVPGLRFDKFVALMRTLRRELRVKFVPVPEFASAAARDLKPSDGPLLEALALHLGKASGEIVRPHDFRPEGISEYLRMNFRVVDAGGKQVAMGRDLGRIRRELGLRARTSFAAAPPPQYHRDDITRWDFGDLPERVEVDYQGTTLNGYLALVDAGGSVSLRLFDSPHAAADAMHGGVRKLFMLQLHDEITHLEHTLPDMDRLCQYYATVGGCDELTHDLLLAIADRAFFQDEPSAEVRRREEFVARAEAGWRRLAEAAAEITSLAAELLEVFHAMNVALSPDFPTLWTRSIRDMRDQLAHLVYPSFLVRTPFQWLKHLPRYLRGIEIRLKRLADAGLNRDTQAMADVLPLWEQYKRRAADQREQGVADPLLDEFRWMMEELRVSLFAQDLKTAMPVSARRLSEQWELLSKPRT